MNKLIGKVKNLFKNPEGWSTTLPERFSYWCFGGGMLVFYQIVASFMNTFIIMQGVDMIKVAAIILAVKVWDAVNDPLFAFIFDKIKFKKEKCLPWLRIAAILMPFASIAFFHMPHDWDESGKLIWFAATYVLWDFCFTINDIPFYSMSTTMSVNTEERDWVYNVARVFNGGGYFLVQIVMTWLIGEGVGMDFGKASLIVCLIGLPFIIPLCFIGKERYAVPVETEKKEKYTLKQMFTFLFSNKYLLIMYSCQVLADLLNTGGAAGLIGTYYVYGGTKWTILNTIIGMLPGPVLGFLIPKWLKKVDRFTIYMTAVIIGFAWTTLNLFAYPMGFATKEMAYYGTILTAVPGVLRSIVAYSFTLDTLEYGRYKTGIDGTGINFAIQTLSTKLPASIGTSLGTFLLGLTGIVLVEAESIGQLAEMQIVQTRDAMLNMHWAGCLPGWFSSCLSIVLLLFFYKLKSKDVAIMARYNAGEITREECDSMLSRKY